MSSFHQLLDRIREATEGLPSRERGKRFEQLVLRFLKYEPTYKERFSEVWVWSEWEGNNGMQDVGIDLVAKETEGEDRYVGIQCKCFDDARVLSEKDLGTFFTSLYSKWTLRDDRRVFMVGGIVVSTCRNTSSNFDKLLRRQNVPCSYIGLGDLESYTEVSWDDLERGKAHDIEKKKLRDYQADAIGKVTEAFRSGQDRGQLLMACGTGKTFTALRLTEEYTRGGAWMCAVSCTEHRAGVADLARVDDPY